MSLFSFLQKNETPKHKIGVFGEKTAARFLKKNGYRILVRNWRYRHDEVDIIAYNREFLVFVEVKTRSVAQGGEAFCGTAALAVGKEKQTNLRRAAFAFLRSFGKELQPRFDVIEVYLDKTAKKPTVLKVNHIRNAF